MHANRIVVGTDGSGPARAAVDWAAREAALRGAELLIIHGWWTAALGVDPTGEAFAACEQAGERVLADAAAAAASVAPGVSVHTSLVGTSPAEALVEASKDAAMVVVGSRGHGGLHDLLLGSVSQPVLHHAHCPAVLIRHHRR